MYKPTGTETVQAAVHSAVNTDSATLVEILFIVAFVLLCFVPA